MANPYHHAVSSSRKWGGEPEDYLHVHEWFDETKGWLPDFRHRAIRHHSEGIAEAVKLFKPIVIQVEPGGKSKVIPVRFIAEQHVLEDIGRIPTAADWLRCMNGQPWMTRNARKLSRELEAEDVGVAPEKTTENRALT